MICANPIIRLCITKLLNKSIDGDFPSPFCYSYLFVRLDHLSDSYKLVAPSFELFVPFLFVVLFKVASLSSSMATDHTPQGARATPEFAGFPNPLPFGQAPVVVSPDQFKSLIDRIPAMAAAPT